MRKHKRSKLLAGKRGLPIKIGIGAVLLIVILIIIIPSGGSPSAGAEKEAVIKRGALRVAVSAEGTGFFNESEKGLEAVLAQRIADEIFENGEGNGAVTFTHTEPSFMDTYFNDASVDMAIMRCPRGMQETKYAYSDAYYMDKCLVIINKNADPDNGLNGMKIGVVKNSICETLLDEYIQETKLDISKEYYSIYELMLNSLRNGDIDACTMPKTIYKKYDGDFSIHSKSLGDIEYAVLVSSENSGLVTVVNSVLKDMRESGELDRLIKTYIGE